MLSKLPLVVAMIAGLFPAILSTYRPFTLSKRPYYDLGILRILVFGLMLIQSLYSTFPSLAVIPHEFRKEVGLIPLFSGYIIPNSFLAVESTLSIVHLILLLATCLSLLGYMARVSMPMATLLFFYEQQAVRSYLYFSHSGLAIVYLSILLCFAPCCQELAIAKTHSKSKSPEFYLRLSVLIISLIYVSAGLSKITFGGAMWWEGENLRTHLLRSASSSVQLNHDPKAIILNFPTWLLSIGGLTSLLSETLYAWVLVSSFAMATLPILIVIMHLSIMGLQKIVFLDLIVLSSFVAYLGICRYKFCLQKTPQIIMFSKTFAIILAVQIWSIVTQFEAFPISPFYMYALKNRIGELEYHKASKRDAYGKITEFRIQDGIPAFNGMGFFLGYLAFNQKYELVEKMINCSIQRASGENKINVQSVLIQSIRMTYNPEQPTLTNDLITKETSFDVQPDFKYPCQTTDK